jgi:hypothetical protein
VAIDERRRLALHEAARGTWGAEMAATFLEMLPPAGWGDVATRQQMTALEDRLTMRIEASEHRLRAEMAESLLRMQRWTVGTILASAAAVIAAVGLMAR